MNKPQLSLLKRLGILTVVLAIGLAVYWLNRSPDDSLMGLPGRIPASARHEETRHDPAESEMDERIELSNDSLRLAGIRIERVQTRTLNRTLSIVGQVEAAPQGTVHLNSRVTGRVLELRVGIGDTVKQGQIVAILDSEEIHRAEVAYAQASRQVSFAKAEWERRKQMAALGAYSSPPLEDARKREAEAEAALRQVETDLRRAKESLIEAQARLRSEQTTLAHLEQKVQRSAALLEEQLIPRQEYEAILAQKAITEAAVSEAEARVQSARAALEGYESQLQTANRQKEIGIAARKRAETIYQKRFDTRKEVAEAETLYRHAVLAREAALDELHLLGGQPNGGHKLVLRAPISGRITARLVSIGETVTPDKPLYDILNSSTLWVSFDLYQEDLPFVQPGQTVLFTSPSVPGVRFTGRVSSISDILDPNLRTVKARCVFTNTGGKLKPGMFVDGALTISKQAAVLAVPQEAVQTLRGKPVAFLPEQETGSFRIQEIEIGELADGFIPVHNGLKLGDRIVVKNAHVLLAHLLRGEMGDDHDH